MARIPEQEIERLKAEVSVERLVEGSGIALKRSGKDFVGRCPFHEDDTASLWWSRLRRTCGTASAAAWAVGRSIG